MKKTLNKELGVIYLYKFLDASIKKLKQSKNKKIRTGGRASKREIIAVF